MYTINKDDFNKKIAQYICINVIGRETAKLNRTSIQCWFKTEEKRKEKKRMSSGEGVGGGLQTETDTDIYIYTHIYRERERDKCIPGSPFCHLDSFVTCLEC